MVVFPNAKINIGLKITGKRNDGYHNIESCFYPIGWSDILEVTESRKLTFSSTGIPIPGTWDENLCIKAFKILQETYQIPPVNVHLHKIIPIGAGLGGGSADGAFTLKALNDLYDLKIEPPLLKEYALRLGSDCPFFINNQPTFVSGRGEIFEEIAVTLKGKNIVLVNPPIHVSTAEAYGGIKSYSSEGLLKSTLLTCSIEDWQGKIKNDFEASVFNRYPEIATIRETLYKNGAIYASMTGSGASLFGIFNETVDFRDRFPINYIIWQGLLQ